MVLWRSLRVFVLLSALLSAGCRSASLEALRYGMWYWHTPFRVTPQEAKDLRSIGVDTLYVRAATLATDGEQVKSILPQKWSKVAGFRLVAVFNFDPGLVSHFEELGAERIGDGAANQIQAAISKAEKEGVRFEGVQLDVDCPTRLLPLYGKILHRVRGGLGKMPLSITALPTWLSSTNLESITSEVDWIAPQFYEGRTGKSIESTYPVSDPDALRRGLQRLEKLGIPCQVGLATYGHALLYDENGKLLAMYRGLSPEDALRHPALRLESAEPARADGKLAKAEVESVGEDRLTLRALHADSQGRGKGFRIVYFLPTPAMVQRQLSVVRANRFATLSGAIFYRFSEPGESMALPLASVASAAKGESPKLELRPSLKCRSVPYALIDSGRQVARAPKELRVEIESRSNVPTLPGPDSVEVTVSLDRPGVDEIQLGDFDEASFGNLDGAGHFVRTSPNHADLVRLRRFHLLPGERLRSGGIVLSANGASNASVSWRATGPGGFQTFHGAVPWVGLDDKR